MEPIKLKVLLTAAIIASGALIVVLIGPGASATAYQAQGVVVDFGDRDIVWTDIDLHIVGDPIELLMIACEENGFECDITDKTVMKISRTAEGVTKEYESGPEREWGFWVIEKGETDWVKIASPYNNVDPLSCTTCAWAYCSVSEKPAVGADQVGNSIFGYERPFRTVSLSPSMTEIMGALNAVSTLVGTDKYSNYPYSVTEGQAKGDIAIVGDYVNPSFEMIMGADPDMVYCDGSQYIHYEMSERLRRANVPAVVLYAGESTETIIDNIYIMGVTLQYEMAAQGVITMLKEAEEYLTMMLMSGGTDFVRTMFALSPDKSPWVAGQYTYMDDISTAVFGENSMAMFFGWAHISSEVIASANPSVVVILAETYVASPSEYDGMIGQMSAEWKSTDAYKNGKIYIFCGELGEMASRPGPRYMQIMELFAMILHPDMFAQELPKYIGNEYGSYLTITKDLGFNNE